MPKGAVLHIGCNTQKESGGFQGPVFGDGSFKFIPIPEKEYCSESSWTYEQLSLDRHPSLHDLNHWLPRGWRWDHAHYDPEFVSFTWGDYRNKRTFQARELQAGDYYFFIASLRYREQGAKREACIDPDWAYYFIGFFLVNGPPIELSYPISIQDRQRFPNNAHVRRPSNVGLEPFLLFRGSKVGSRLLNRAVPISNKRTPNALARQIMPWLNEPKEWVGRWWEQGLIAEEGVQALLNSFSMQRTGEEIT